MQFRLLDLPPEIWSHIVKLAVEGADYDIGNSEKLTIFNRRRRLRGTTQPGITRTCRAIRHETIPHFYTSNSFTFYDNPETVRAMFAWLKVIGSAYWPRLKKLYIVSEFNWTLGYLDRTAMERKQPFIVDGERVDGGASCERKYLLKIRERGPCS